MTTIQVPDRITNLIAAFTLLENLHHELNLAQVELEEATGGRPICIANCGKCCENVPVASEIEAKYVLSSIHTLPNSQEIKKRALGWMAEKHKGLKLWEKIRGRPYRQEEQELLHEDQQVLQKTGCPFLARDKSCMIHSLRPLVCRAYGITLSADPYCPRPLHPTETTTRRMGIAPNGPRGKRIQRAKQNLFNFLRIKMPGTTFCSWLPGLLARELAKEELLSLQQEGKVADIKLAIGRLLPRLWHDEQSEDAIPLIPIAEKGDNHHA